MPATKIRTKIRATGGIRPGNATSYTDVATDGFQTMSGCAAVYKDLVIPWQAVFISACLNQSGSVAVGLVDGAAGSVTALAYSNTANASPLTIALPVPLDAATAGSGTLYLDWTDTGTNSAVAAIGACIALVPNGSAWSDSGTSALNSGSGACVTLTTSACEFTSSSILQFNAPNTRDGFLALRIVKRTGDTEDTADAFKLLGLRLRYVADRIGKQLT